MLFTIDANKTVNMTTTYATYAMIGIVMTEIWDFAEVIEATMCINVKIFHELTRKKSLKYG
ncbi:hypothetical protein GQX74_014045 [Glossina fuscipes]|nr:hypothetical protein GQX74_014045 [Glossina fuscipes]